MFRPANHSDTETLIEFMRQLYEYDNSYFDETNARKALPALIESDLFGRVWVICDGDKSIGYMVLTFAYSLEFHGRDAFIDELYLSDGFRKQGMGKLAIELAEETCRRTRY